MLIELPARRGTTIALAAGRSIRIVNTHGGQVVDVWAILQPGDHPFEHLSMPHSVVSIGGIKPAVGDVLVSDLRQPVLTLTEDRSPQTHCMLFAACDPARYALLGHHGHHANCADNLRRAIGAIDQPLPFVPTPQNLFMNTKFAGDRVMTVEAPAAVAGDSITFRAERACLIVLSACPQDLLPVNGLDCTPKAVGFEVLS